MRAKRNPMGNTQPVALCVVKLYEHYIGAKALKASKDGNAEKAVWLPLSQLHVVRDPKMRKRLSVTMPEWLAIRAGLVKMKVLVGDKF